MAISSSADLYCTKEAVVVKNYMEVLNITSLKQLEGKVGGHIADYINVSATLLTTN